MPTRGTLRTAPLAGTLLVYQSVRAELVYVLLRRESWSEGAETISRHGMTEQIAGITPSIGRAEMVLPQELDVCQSLTSFSS